MNYTDIICHHNNGYFEKELKNKFGYKVTVYDEFETDKILDMLLYIDKLGMTTIEINTNDSKILNDLTNIKTKANVNSYHVEQLLKVLEWRYISHDLWYSKSHDEEQKSRKEALNTINDTPEEEKVYVKDLIDINKDNN